MACRGQPILLPRARAGGPIWGAVVPVSLAEEKVPGALNALGPCKFLFAQAAATGLWESGKEELNWEKMVNLLECGKLRAPALRRKQQEDVVRAEI